MRQSRKLTLIIILLVVTFTSAASFERQVRLTIINQTDVDLAIRLENQRLELSYYLTIPPGDKDTPAEKIFTIVPASYIVTAYYMETYDPVYGYPKCGGKVQSATYNLTVNTRLLFKPCPFAPSNAGEMGFWKFGAPTFRRRP